MNLANNSPLGSVLLHVTHVFGLPASSLSGHIDGNRRSSGLKKCLNATSPSGAAICFAPSRLRPQSARPTGAYGSKARMR